MRAKRSLSPLPEASKEQTKEIEAAELLKYGIISQKSIFFSKVLVFKILILTDARCSSFLPNESLMMFQCPNSSGERRCTNATHAKK